MNYPYDLGVQRMYCDRCVGKMQQAEGNQAGNGFDPARVAAAVQGMGNRCAQWRAGVFERSTQTGVRPQPAAEE